MPKKIENPEKLIFDCAKKILLEEGYAQLNIRTIAKRCEISVGTVYNYFEDKRVLDMALMSAFWAEFETVIVDIFAVEDQDLFWKLNRTQEEMNIFVRKFVELFSELFRARQNTYDGKEKEEKNRLIQKLSLIVEKEILKTNPSLEGTSPNAKEIADWIFNSMMMVSHMREMTYEQLEKFIKKMIL